MSSVDWIFVDELAHEFTKHVGKDLGAAPGAVAYLEAHRQTRDAITAAIPEGDR